MIRLCKVSKSQGTRNSLDCNQNDLEQRGRANSIRIMGLEDNKEKETVQESKGNIVKLVSNRLGVHLEPRDIDIAHRLGEIQTEQASEYNSQVHSSD